MSKPKLWTKDFIIVSSINFFLALVFYLLIVIIGVFAVEEYQATASQAGLITGIFIIGTLIGRLFIGRKIESYGLKKTMIIGLILYILTTSLYFIHAGVQFLLLNRFVHGIALGIASTAVGTIVARIIPAERKGEGIGYFSMSATLATAIGPFIGMSMTQITSYQTMFGLCLLLGIISLITGSFVRMPASAAAVPSEQNKGFKISNFVEPKAVPIAIITLLISFCYSGVLSFINFYSKEIDLVKAASYFFLVYSIAVLLSRPFTGRLMDSKGANFIMYPAFIIFTIGLVLLSQSSSGLMLLVSAALIGLGFGNMQSCTQAIAVMMTPIHRMGMATSTFFIFLDAGFGFGPYVLGLFIPVVSYRSMYMILSLFVLATAVLYFFLHGKKETAGVKAAAR